MIECLPRRLERALDTLLLPKEIVYVKIRGAHKEALICTDIRVILLKGGYMTGQILGTRDFHVRYRDISGVQVKSHWLTGYFELATSGMQNLQNPRQSYWRTNSFDSAAKRSNCISLNSPAQIKKFRQACSLIMTKIS